MNWRRAHWRMGVAVLVVFLGTGQFMLYREVSQFPDAVRAVYRSRHLFLLLAALANLALAGSVVDSRLGKLASGIVLIAPLLLFVAFAIEPLAGIYDARFSAAALYLLFAAAVALAIANRRT